MIVYRELSSLEADLGCSAKKMYSLSNDIRAHYRKTYIPKGNGELRKLLGRVNYVLSVERENAEYIHYKEWLVQAVKKVYTQEGSEINT